MFFILKNVENYAMGYDKLERLCCAVIGRLDDCCPTLPIGYN